MIRYLTLFLTILLGLALVYNLDPIAEWLLRPWNQILATASYGLIHLFSQDVFLNGTVLYSATSGFSVSVEADCNGLEATMILLAAVLAFPAPWRGKLAGVILGALAVQTLNLTRIVMLFYLGGWNTTIFEWAHKYIWPVLIIIGALAVFFLWIRAFSYRPVAPHAEGAEKPA